MDTVLMNLGRQETRRLEKIVTSFAQALGHSKSVEMALL